MELFYILGNGNPEKFYYIFSKETLILLYVLIFRPNRKLEKNPYISGNRLSCISLIFQNVTLGARKLKKKRKKKIWNFFLYFLKKSFSSELSYIFRVIKTNSLVLLVLKDKNSCLFSQGNPAVFFIFHVFQVFHFLPFSGAFLLLYRKCYNFQIKNKNIFPLKKIYKARARKVSIITITLY